MCGNYSREEAIRGNTVIGRGKIGQNTFELISSFEKRLFFRLTTTNTRPFSQIYFLAPLNPTRSEVGWSTHIINSPLGLIIMKSSRLWSSSED